MQRARYQVLPFAVAGSGLGQGTANERAHASNSGAQVAGGKGPNDVGDRGVAAVMARYRAAGYEVRDPPSARNACQRRLCAKVRLRN